MLKQALVVLVISIANVSCAKNSQNTDHVKEKPESSIELPEGLTSFAKNEAGEQVPIPYPSETGFEHQAELHKIYLVGFWQGFGLGILGLDTSCPHPEDAPESVWEAHVRGFYAGQWYGLRMHAGLPTDDMENSSK